MAATKARDILLVGYVLLSLAACNATRVVKPLDKGEQRVAASFGGPTIVFAGAPIPLPLSSLAWQWGLDSNLSLTVGWQTTSALFGVAHTDVSLAIGAFVSESERFGVTVSPGVHFLMDVFEFNYRNYPQLDAIAWYRPSVDKPHLIYGGFGSWVEFYRQRAHAQPQPNEFMPWFVAGYQHMGKQWQWSVEMKYLGFQHDNRKLVVKYVSPTNHGALGAYFGVSRRITK
ncbi:MAG: hypothetical protein Kow0075_13810 [Salibacteraceae bacterium]